MLKKNNKGFFLAETIVVVALVTTVMAFVYPNLSKIYENYKNKAKYYDQPEDLYVLKAIYESKQVDILAKTENNGKQGCKKIGGTLNNGSVATLDTNTNPNPNALGIYSDSNNHTLEEANGLEKLYIVSYMATDLKATKDFDTKNGFDDSYNFQKYLNRMKKITSDSKGYRLIGKFCNDFANNTCNSEAGVRYASIKINNPNSYVICN